MTLIITGCPQNDEPKTKEEEKANPAALYRIKIGGLIAPNLGAGVAGAVWDDASFNIRGMGGSELKLAGGVLTEPAIETEASPGATVQFAHVTTEGKPDTFEQEHTFTFSSGDYLYIQVTSADGAARTYYRVQIFSTTGDARLKSLTIAKVSAVLAEPGKTSAGALEGSVTFKGMSYNSGVVNNPLITLNKETAATVAYAVGAGAFSGDSPAALNNGDVLWVRVTAEDGATVLYYQIKVTVQYSTEDYGEADPAWAADPYNASLRVFPNAPNPGILEYSYFDTNAPPNYWNTKGHNHKYPDLFHFANGNKVRNIADWENRRTEIFNILQYYMHGRMPSIDPDVLTIRFTDSGNTCTIDLTHVASNRTAQFIVNHSPPDDAVDGARDKILLFGVGGNPAARAGWGRASFQTSWAGAENNRSGTCATLYGLNGSANDTPSVNMQYAWAMSVILTVIEQGGFNGYYDPAKVGIYGFSRYGKAAMLIGAFAESRGGTRIGQTFIGSAGSGGPSLDRFIAQVGYKSFNEDPLPVDATGAMNFNDLTTMIWYQRLLTDTHYATPEAGNNDREVIRGWTAATPGIPPGSHIYVNPSTDIIAKPYVKQAADPEGIRDGFGGIQNLSQARGEVGGWFSARFRSLQDLHNGLDLDHDFDQTGRGKEGVVCTMPFDAHYIAALIAPRIVYFEDGYDTTRNNTEAQWANWLIIDEIYQMYAEELGDPSIIWRNAIKLYHIPHMHQAYQNQDEYDLVTAIYSGTQPNVKFRMPPFPADDPRYRWDFNRMDFGRPGHPTIAERVAAMRDSPFPVKAVDERGLLDAPEAE